MTDWNRNPCAKHITVSGTSSKIVDCVVETLLASKMLPKEKIIYIEVLYAIALSVDPLESHEFC
jgi:hypothetical protein